MRNFLKYKVIPISAYALVTLTVLTTFVYSKKYFASETPSKSLTQIAEEEKIKEKAKHIERTEDEKKILEVLRKELEEGVKKNSWPSSFVVNDKNYLIEYTYNSSLSTYVRNLLKKYRLKIFLVPFI